MSLLKLEDKELVSLYIKGSENAFETLLMRHKDKVYNYIYIKVRDTALAQDIFQDTFIKVVKTLKKGSYNEEGKFLPWAMRIAHNLVIDHFRRTSKVKMISESSSKNEDFTIFSVLERPDENVEQTIIREELEGQMVELVEYLPDAQKKILRMRIFQEMSFKDIADLENISINTALGRMRYALINLRKMIDEKKLVTPL
jgi:RNA polymerase sigma-70 factor (ECF subfamily)